MARLRRPAARARRRQPLERDAARLASWALAAALLVGLAAAAGWPPAPAAAGAWSVRSIAAVDLNAVAALPGTSSAWAVGNAGTVYATVDGTTWTAQAVGTTTQHLRAVAVVAPGPDRLTQRRAALVEP